MIHYSFSKNQDERKFPYNVKELVQNHTENRTSTWMTSRLIFMNYLAIFFFPVSLHFFHLSTVAVVSASLRYQSLSASQYTTEPPLCLTKQTRFKKKPLPSRRVELRVLNTVTLDGIRHRPAGPTRYSQLSQNRPSLFPAFGSFSHRYI